MVRGAQLLRCHIALLSSICLQCQVQLVHAQPLLQLVCVLFGQRLMLSRYCDAAL